MTNPINPNSPISSDAQLKTKNPNINKTLPDELLLKIFKIALESKQFKKDLTGLQI